MSPVEAQPAYCGQCGTPIHGAATECGRCGADQRRFVGSEEFTRTPTHRAEPTDVEVSRNTHGPHSPNAARAKRIRFIPRLLGGLFLVGGASAAAALLLTGGDTDVAPSIPASPPRLSIDAPEIGEIVFALEDGSPRALLSAMSQELLGKTLPSEFAKAVARAERKTGPIENISVAGPVTSRIVPGGGAGSLQMTIDYRHLPPREYTAYMLYERGAWRLWFTAPVERSGR